MGRSSAQVLKCFENPPKSRIADGVEFRYEGVIDGGGRSKQGGDKKMADLGIARINNEAESSNTLTRADLADVVHRKLGLSRAESAGVVERVLHHMCHSLAEGKNVK